MKEAFLDAIYLPYNMNFLTKKTFHLVPPLRIHIWGGLGSQLFALALCIQIIERFPQRRVAMIFHSSGVTRRDPELPKLPDVSYSYVDDYRPKNRATNLEQQNSKKFQVLVKSLLIKLGFVSQCNTAGQWQVLKPWVFSIRGHYSYLPLKLKTLEFVFGLVESNSTKQSGTHDFFGLHLRLGDLLSLATQGNKAPMDPKILANIIKELECRNLRIYSDSPSQVVYEHLKSYNLEYHYVEENIFNTILDLSKCHFFIGTSSKITIWIVALRSLLKSGKSTIPSDQLQQVQFLIPDFRDYLLENVTGYRSQY